MRKYAVLHDYGSEGWHIVSEADSLIDAVEIRERDVASGGGKVIIVEVLDTFEAYSDAAYERRQAQRATDE